MKVRFLLTSKPLFFATLLSLLVETVPPRGKDEVMYPDAATNQLIRDSLEWTRSYGSTNACDLIHSNFTTLTLRFNQQAIKT